jgi:hypothetical protein
MNVRQDQELYHTVGFSNQSRQTTPILSVRRHLCHLGKHSQSCTSALHSKETMSLAERKSGDVLRDGGIGSSNRLDGSTAGRDDKRNIDSYYGIDPMAEHLCNRYSAD